MTRELGTLDLDKQIRVEESASEAIQLKRDGDSPISNTTSMPPEVACHTPELWSHWGDSLENWKLSSLHSKTLAPVDLVLIGENEVGGFFDEDLRNTLRDRAAADIIRKIHLRGQDRGLLTSILGLLTPEDDAVQHSSMESIVLDARLDTYDFFARRHFAKLRDLSLRCADLPLVPLKDNTKALVELTLSNEIDTSTSTPTTSQIISLLASNPNIQTLDLRLEAFDDDTGSNPGDLVPLRYLEKLSLNGKAHDICPIMSRLESFDTINELRLVLSHCTSETITKVIGSYLRAVLQGDARRREELNVQFTDGASIMIFVRLAGAGAGASRPRAFFSLSPAPDVTPEQKKQMCSSALAVLPKEDIINYQTDFLEIEEMPKLQTLHLVQVEISNGFLLPKSDGPNAHEKLLPSLKFLFLEEVTTKDNNWDPLIDYLQTDSRLAVLTVLGTHICPEVVEKIKSLVLLIYLPDMHYRCPRAGCMQ